MTRDRDEPSTSASMLQRARQGDADSWKHLAHVYGPVIYGWARRCGCQQADAADVMQDTLVSVAAGLTRFDGERDGATFRGWLWTITRNKMRDRQRRAGLDAPVGGTQARLAMNQVADAASIDATDPPTDAASDVAGARRRMLELLRHEFDPRSWRMFWETTAVEREVADVAAEMGVSKWAVYKARARVLQRLQQEMNGLE
ncbi:sigma-70 family RNA polymerase sigma factor [Roseiconus nitratireducens]|uniref:Sigma-70 family RNA polymerase sigma factor n=2 Tax=Roseiconus nitratireducens TaxID=2605748 RepID=A0A5M6DAZ6_9BACT|nr:sigma-70 family RNA polymerase sigma factor [Roseiconus nitratireducens]